MINIYYNEKNNTIHLSKKRARNRIFLNTQLSNKTYLLGQLLIDFIELDFNKIHLIFKKALNLPTPVSVDSINGYISDLRKIYKELYDIHPYFCCYDTEFINYSGDYGYWLSQKIKYEKICSDESWVNSQENVNSIKYNELDLGILELITNLSNNLLTFDKFKDELMNYIIDHLEALDLIKEFEFQKHNYKYISRNFKEAVEFCIDAEQPAKLLNLSPQQRFYLYQLKMDPDIRNSSIDTKYAINLINESRGYSNIEKNPQYCTSEEFLNMLSEEFLESLENEPQNLYEIHEVGITEACYFEFMELVKKGTLVRKCHNCNKYFINTGRIDTLYCDRKSNSDNKTCKDVGAMNSYREKIKDDPIIKEYNKAYKRNNARVKYGKMTQNEFLKWSDSARELRDKAKNGEITLDWYKAWLNN